MAILEVDTAIPSEPKNRVKGYLPTLCYPHATEVSSDGEMLFITSGKGTGTGTNKPNLSFPHGQNPRAYIATQLKGSLHQIGLKMPSPS